MTHDNHTRCRSSFRKSERARDPELGIWTRECVLASVLYTMTVDGGRGTVSARLALQQTRNFSAGDHCTPLSRNERKFGMPAQAHTHLILIYDNHTRLELEKIGRPGTRNLLDSCVC